MLVNRVQRFVGTIGSPSAAVRNRAGFGVIFRSALNPGASSPTVNTKLLIDNVVRQTTILIAQLATSGGVRAPLAHIANQVFLELAKELESQGISKQVTADMFGMALRSYRRRVQRLDASATDRDRSLWEAVLGYLSKSQVVTRKEVLKRFFRDDENQVKSVLVDLCDSGLVFRLGSGANTAYRAATNEEITQLSEGSDAADELVWLVVYREGPVSVADLAKHLCMTREQLEPCLERLSSDERVHQSRDGRYRSTNAVMPMGSGAGWEAAMFDHFQAVVNTLCARLQAMDEATSSSERGGSTYGFNVWPGHPHEAEVRGALAEFRAKYTELRERVQRYNSEHTLPNKYTEVVIYGGQHLTDQETDDSD